jgi:alkylation response protein AidB-like acyl-CoA dehydrogenase
MDFTLPPELTTLSDTVVRFVAAEIEPAIGAYEYDQRFPHEIIEKMGTAGLFGAAFPKTLGGSEMGFQAVAIIAEELSRTRPEFGYTMNMQAMTCPFTIFNWGSDEQAQRFVPDLIAGRKLGMFALTESGGGSDPAGAMKSRAVRDGSRYVLSGSKMWITMANVCDSGVIFVKTDPDAGHRGITAFIIEPKSAPGFRADPVPMSGLSALFRSNAVFLDDVAVPVENRLGEEGEGFKIAMNALDYGRLTVAARLLGLAQGCLDQAINYANQRSVGGQVIARYQMVQQSIADMTVDIAAARLMVQQLGWTMDQGLPMTRIAAHAKYFAQRAAKHAADSAAEIFGGYALADEYPINKLAAYIHMLNVGEGTANVQRILIAEDALGLKDADRHPVRNRAAAN